MTTPSEEAVEAALSVLLSSIPENFAIRSRAALKAAYAIDMERVRREALEEAAEVAVQEYVIDPETGVRYVNVQGRYIAPSIRALANTKQA
jgi:hypothetical protein